MKEGRQLWPWSVAGLGGDDVVDAREAGGSGGGQSRAVSVQPHQSATERVRWCWEKIVQDTRQSSAKYSNHKLCVNNLFDALSL